MNVIMTGPNSWIITGSEDCTSKIILRPQVENKKHHIIKIFIQARATTVQMIEGLDNKTEQRELINTTHSAANETDLGFVYKFVKPLSLNINKALILKASSSTPVSFIIEGETI